MDAIVYTEYATDINNTNTIFNEDFELSEETRQTLLSIISTTYKMIHEIDLNFVSMFFDTFKDLSTASYEIKIYLDFECSITTDADEKACYIAMIEKIQ